MALDLSAYFDRIGYRGAAEPTLDVLQDLVTRHIRTIPFENLDPLLGVPIDDLSPEALTDKLVHRRRGGYCYEHNGLMGYVLAELGFQVRRFAARVVWTLPPDAPPTPPPSPLRFEIGGVQQTTHEAYRLEDRGEGLVLQTQVRGDWQALYEFAPQTRAQIDLKLGSWYVSTHPASHFVTGLMAALVTDDARWNLSGRTLTIHRADGSEKILLDGAAAVVDMLADRFGVNVADVGERSVLEARIDQVCAGEP
jgi:arylamine N-acetyltransferase